jgi:hypothetical protein
MLAPSLKMQSAYADMVFAVLSISGSMYEYYIPEDTAD